MAKEEDIEKLTSEHQEQIMEQIRKKYSETVSDHWQNLRNMKWIGKPDRYAQEEGFLSTLLKGTDS